MKSPQTILAIDPGLRDLGYVVLRGRTLIDFGVSTFRFLPKDKRHAAALHEVRDRIHRHEPDVLILEATHRSRHKSFQALWRFTNSVRRLAHRAKIDTADYAAQTVRKALVGSGWANKRDTAVTMAVRYPALRIFVKQDREWKERHFQNMFDALALAVYQQELAR